MFNIMLISILILLLSILSIILSIISIVKHTVSIYTFKKGVNMKCECCFKNGFHYHYITTQDENKYKFQIMEGVKLIKEYGNLFILQHRNHGHTKRMCPICKIEKGRSHYHSYPHIKKNLPNIPPKNPIKCLEINMKKM